MSNRTHITIEGWRPWSKRQRSGIAINGNDPSVFGGRNYLKHLRLALKALYYHEENKYKEHYGKELCECETPPNMTLDIAPPLCGRCQKEIPPVPRWEEKPCQSTLIAAEIPAVDADTNSKPSSPKPTKQETSTKSPAPSVEKN
jgi:hypothetical protein